MSLHPSSSQALHGGAVGLIGVLAGLWVAAPSVAAPARVGTASSINDSVTGALGGRPFVVSVGDDVKLRETVQTDSSGQAHLLLVDDTDVAILSRSTMTVERYAPGSKLVSTPDGTFLVHTGHGTPGEPRFDTSAGTLVPQGTRFWFNVRNGHIKLDVQEGAVRFCPRGKSQAYCVLATPGHKVVGSAGAPAQVLGMAEPPPPAPPAPPPYPTRINYPYPNDYPGPYNPYVRPWPHENCVQTENCGCAHAGYGHGRGGGCGTRADGRWNNNVGSPDRGGGGGVTKTGGGGPYTGKDPYRAGSPTTNGGGKNIGDGGPYTGGNWKPAGGGSKSAEMGSSNSKYFKTNNSYASGYFTHGNPASSSMRGYPAGMFQRVGRSGLPFRGASGFNGGSGFVR